MTKDYYDILGISKDASKEEIRSAYKKLAKKYHPDLHKGEKDKEEKFKEINEAYKALSDDKTRANYDRFGNADDQFSDFEGFGQGGFSDFSEAFSGFGDIFGDIFGANTGSHTRGRSYYRGNDLRYDLEITLEEAAFGIEKEISVRKRSVCSECNGTGAENEELKTCSTCQGSGRIRRTQRTPFGIFQSTGTCPDCLGTGKVPGEVCSNCNGSGNVLESKTLKIKIPAGVDTGHKLRLQGEGEAGSRGSTPGDLYIFITVKEHKLFERVNDNIYYDANISFVQATLGCEITVPTLYGDKTLKIPQGSQPNTLLRMKNLGINNSDQYVRIHVLIPEKLSKKQKSLLEEFSKSINEDLSQEKKQSFFDKVKKGFN